MKSSPAIRVLLVEDNATDALLLQEELRHVRSPQLVIVHVDRLHDAIQRVRQEQFDIVLLDLGLPDSRGAETFGQLQAAAPHTPIIVLSGLDDEDVAIATVHEGAQDYLVKGRVESDLLVRAMRYAIQRKETEEELREKNEQMQQDLNMAREFQQAFLPNKYPSLPPGVAPELSAVRFAHRYQPSGAVGGDYFDILPLSDSRTAVFICDVMGHGVRAALVTAMIRGLVGEHKGAADDPGKFLTGVNHALANVLKQTDTTMFASAFYMMIDTAKYRIHYADAGHPAPMHVQRARNSVEPLRDAREQHGPVLGLFENSTYPTVDRSIAGGDLIVLYTDGLFEVDGINDEQYGQERLLTAVRRRLSLPAGELFDELLAEIRAYAGTTTFDDDVCLVGVEIGPAR